MTARLLAARNWSYCRLKISCDHKSPVEGGQYYGLMQIDGKTRALTVRLKDLEGTTLFEKTLPPV